jgi:hypothetical protein
MGLFSRHRDDESGPSAWWTVSCKSDPRFNATGSCYSVIGAALECEAFIKRRIKELDLPPEEVPTDIEYGGGKP